MKRLPLFILLIAAACTRTVPSGPATVGLVQDILSGKDSRGAGILAQYPKHSAEGDIYIIGARERSTALGTKMLMADNYDNIDGSAAPDRLPDFAGEKIISVIDQTFTPYSEYKDSLEQIRLRELTVRLTLAAMDTLMSKDPIGFEMDARKSRAKVIILASPEMDACGLWDADSLLRGAGAQVCLISAQGLVREHIAQKHGKDAVVGYLSAVDSIQGTEGQLRAYMEAFTQERPGARLNALVLDDWSLNPEIVAAEYAQLRSSGEAIATAFAPGFEILDVQDMTVRCCYKRMREYNLFTHNIAYPAWDAMSVADHSGVPVLKKYVQN